MGFDMCFVLPPKDLPADYEPCYEEMPRWYQLTFSGMFEVVAIMTAADILDVLTPAPRLPRWPPRGLSPERAEKLKPVLLEPQKLKRRLQPEEAPLIESFLKRWRAATGQRSHGDDVPDYKFTTNDGWLVWPEECRIVHQGLTDALRQEKKLAKAVKARGGARLLPYLRDIIVPWSIYNRVAADHGGYRVW